MNKATRWILAAAVGAAAVVAAAAAAPLNLSQVLAEQLEHVAEHPHDPAALNDLGNLLQLAGAPAEAETAYRRALEVAPDLVSARYNLALLLQRAERYREALSEYQAVVERAPSHAWAHYQIGSIHEAQGDDRRAVRWYGEAFALEPRLAFTDYNPSVIENDLVEEAMLVGYRAEAARPLAAQVYEQPSRIRDLMFSSVLAAEEATPGETSGAVPELEDLANQPDLPRAGAAAGETLDAGSLDARGVNQAAPPGRASARRQTAGQGSPQRTFQRPTAGQPGDRPQPGAVGTPGTLVVQPGFVPQPGQAQPQPRVITPPGSTAPRFRRGVESTGRLELQLVPEATERRG